MGFNHVENHFLSIAIDNLNEQAQENGYAAEHGFVNRRFYLGDGITFMRIDEDPYKGRITIAQRNGKGYVPDLRFDPAPCYDLIPADVDMATAVQLWYYLGRRKANPYTANGRAHRKLDWDAMPTVIKEPHAIPFRREDLHDMYERLREAKREQRTLAILAESVG